MKIDNRFGFSKYEIIYFFILFILLLIISSPALTYPPHSDTWHMFYFIHHLDELPGPVKWLHIANYDPFERMRCQPLSRYFFYIMYLIFKDNYVLYNIVNFLFYFLSIILIYKLALFFVKDKILLFLFITYYAFLFSHFDIILWSWHLYIIIGFCMFLYGFILYINFLKTGKEKLLLGTTALFLGGLTCYETFFLWPLGILILASIKSFKNESLPTKKINQLNIRILSTVYISYFLIFLFTRTLKTYSDSAYHIADFLKVNKIVPSLFLAVFGTFYDNIILNIFPLFSFPLLITENISLHGPTMELIRRNHIFVYGIASIWVVVIGIFLYYLKRKKYTEELKLVFFLFLLIFTEVYILTFCRLITNDFGFSLTEFRYQYIPNTFMILALIVIIDRFISSSGRNKLIALILVLPFVLNIFCIRKEIDIYNFHYANLKKMLVNIKQAIKDGRINQRRKIYIPDDITYYLPGLCWNIVMGERFMEGNYKWIFPKEQISLFVDNLKDAYWTIDKRNFEIITKKQIPQGDIPVINKIESPWYIDVGKDRLYFDVGDYCEKRGNYQKAEKLYKKALEVNPVYLDAYEALGNLYMKLKRFKDAEVMFKKMAALEGDGADAYIKLGYWCRMHKMFDEALKMYKKAQQIDPFNAWLYVEYGNYFLDQGIYDRAEEMYKYALSLDKDNYSIYFDLARCYRLQGQSQRADQMVEIGNGLKAKLEKENP